MGMFGDHVDQRTKRVSSASTFELSILFHLPAWPAHTVHSLRACSYCTVPSQEEDSSHRQALLIKYVVKNILPSIISQ